MPNNKIENIAFIFFGVYWIFSTIIYIFFPILTQSFFSFCLLNTDNTIVMSWLWNYTRIFWWTIVLPPFISQNKIAEVSIGWFFMFFLFSHVSDEEKCHKHLFPSYKLHEISFLSRGRLHPNILLLAQTLLQYKSFKSWWRSTKIKQIIKRAVRKVQVSFI